MAQNCCLIGCVHSYDPQYFVFDVVNPELGRENGHMAWFGLIILILYLIQAYKHDCVIMKRESCELTIDQYSYWDLFCPHVDWFINCYWVRNKEIKNVLCWPWVNNIGFRASYCILYLIYVQFRLLTSTKLAQVEWGLVLIEFKLHLSCLNLFAKFKHLQKGHQLCILCLHHLNQANLAQGFDVGVENSCLCTSLFQFSSRYFSFYQSKRRLKANMLLFQKVTYYALVMKYEQSN